MWVLQQKHLQFTHTLQRRRGKVGFRLLPSNLQCWSNQNVAEWQLSYISAIALSKKVNKKHGSLDRSLVIFEWNPHLLNLVNNMHYVSGSCLYTFHRQSCAHFSSLASLLSQFKIAVHSVKMVYTLIMFPSVSKPSNLYLCLNKADDLLGQMGRLSAWNVLYVSASTRTAC